MTEKQPEKPEKQIRQIVRLINADIPGNTQLYNALARIYGIGYSFSNAVCNIANIHKHAKIGALADEEIKKLEDIIRNPEKYKIPLFIFNRRKDAKTGADRHLVASELKLTSEFDIKRLKKLKTYRGIRHHLGLPVRGQRTKSHFREGKTIGVIKKKVIAQKSSEGAKKEK